MKFNILLKTVLISAATAFLAVSCSLDKFPDNAINTDESMESPADCQAFLNGLYSGMKYIFSFPRSLSASASISPQTSSLLIREG